ncbi:hypothetical protein JTB14_022111 [Gonioctena quinquepunctata]|nr:hypothetical protein JTB14_022111 [Gonioctena quinquepunctata]
MIRTTTNYTVDYHPNHHPLNFHPPSILTNSRSEHSHGITLLSPATRRSSSSSPASHRDGDRRRREITNSKMSPALGHAVAPRRAIPTHPVYILPRDSHSTSVSTELNRMGRDGPVTAADNTTQRTRMMMHCGPTA